MKDSKPEISTHVVRADRNDPYSTKIMSEPIRPQLYEELSELARRAAKYGDSFSHGTTMAINAQMRNLEYGTGEISTFRAIIQEAGEEIEKLETAAHMAAGTSIRKESEKQMTGNMGQMTAQDGADVEVIEVLTREEESRLNELEGVIERNMAGAFDWGMALMEIRGKRLYRKSHDTFEGYLRDRWDIGRSYANKLIEASQVVERLGTFVPILPKNEAQVRPLTKLPPNEQRTAWEKVLTLAEFEKGGVTAKHVEEVVKQIRAGQVQVKVEKVKKEIDFEISSEPFKMAFEAFMEQIEMEAETQWSSVPRRKVLHFINMLKKAIR